tara:strand:- start:23 stop:628 length:606 start_codon:yes stop_codon:yes gene_type:complete
MTSIINKASFFLLITISSCTVDLGYIQLLRESLEKNTITNLDTFYESGFSFIRATKGNNQAVFILSDIDNGFEKWVGSDEEEIITFKGLIIESNKLDYDISHHNKIAIKENFLINDFSSYISLSNPIAEYLPADYMLKKDLNKKDILFCNDIVHIYKRIIPVIKESSYIKICTKEGKVVSSMQRLNPKDKEITIEFFYQYE